MELIERYIEELRTYLPKDIREEVARRLRTELERQLAERSGGDPERADRKLEIELLREVGPPYLVADSHVPRPRVLFGPALYPAFLRTLGIGSVILLALTALSVAVDAYSAPSLLTLAQSLTAAFKSLLIGEFMLIGIAVVVFSLVERRGLSRVYRAETWNPAALPARGDHDRLQLGDQVATIALLVIALLVVNLFREHIGAYVFIQGQRGWVPLLGPAFESHLGLLNLCLGLDLALNLFVLARWRWSTLCRWLHFAINSLYLIWLWRLVTGPSPLSVDPRWLVEHGWSTAAAEGYRDLLTGEFGKVMDLSLELGLAAACVGLAIQLFKLLRALLPRS